MFERPPSFGLNVLGLLCALSFTSRFEAGAQNETQWPGAELFTNGPPRNLHLQIAIKDMEALRRDAREFVRANVEEQGSLFKDVAVHLKGSVGSFRELDDKPGFTLDFARFHSGQKFHGLRRVHLNNSVEDPSYCNEQIGNELFRRAGIPAPRVGHVVVFLNERRLGLYVLKEGFTEEFLSCYFNPISGDLFEPGEGHDVNQRLKRVTIQGSKHDRNELAKLGDAVLEPELGRRWDQLGKALNLREFIDFMVLEVMLCHRDGYSLARNNFRIYRNLESGKFLFFPHGMDQLFGSADLPWQPQMAGLLAKTVLETPEGLQRYTERFHALFAEVFRPQALTNQIDDIVLSLGSSLTRNEITNVRAEAELVKERIGLRYRNLALQLTQPKREPLRFHDSTVVLDNWTKNDEPLSGKMEICTNSDGIRSLHIYTQAETSASWRSNALLEPGKYRFEGKARVEAVKPLPYGSHQGAGLRVSGHARQSADLTGTSSWQPLSADFQVDKPLTEIEFICELRASSGQAWFDAGSLRVTKIP